MQTSIANAVACQMLPDCVVKGGTSLMLRAGIARSRFSGDVDVAWSPIIPLEEFIEDYASNLNAGWAGFTGTIESVTSGAAPDRVPEEYHMRRYRVRLSFMSKTWTSVVFEVSHDEIGSTKKFQSGIAADLVQIFLEIGLPEPSPVPLMTVEHQVAQKLHACTSVSARTGRNERAHDLVDLQILSATEDIDYAATGVIVRRLFAARKEQAWPPTIVVHEGWEPIYVEAAQRLDVQSTVHEAVDWGNELISKLDAAI